MHMMTKYTRTLFTEDDADRRSNNAAVQSTLCSKTLRLGAWTNFDNLWQCNHAE